MKYVFFGTPEFAAIILEKLINVGFIPEAVICNPDKPVGRKQIITPPATKLLAQKYNIPVLQPESLEIRNWDLEIEKIKNGIFDFFVVAAYSKILPKEILEIPRLGTIGVHPSLLPKYRGPSPIQTAILNGDEIIGASLYLMDEKIDHGAIIANSELRIKNSEWNYENLSQKLAELGADLLIEFLQKIESISNQQLAISNLAISQDESQATYTKKFKTEDAYIEPKDLENAQKEGGEIAINIDRKIRALNPELGTWTFQQFQDKLKRMKILEAVLTPDGKLKLKKIQYEGKKPVEI